VETFHWALSARAGAGTRKVSAAKETIAAIDATQTRWPTGGRERCSDFIGAGIG
jgi:hypothetical protein